MRLYITAIRAAALRQPKARQWVAGRKDWRDHLQQFASSGTAPVVWVHCASYGEFEQGRPLMEMIRMRQPNCRILLTFFSPSGFEAFKAWKGADFVCYLPADTATNATDFIHIVKPVKAVFIKYEFWLNFLNALKSHNIDTYLVSAVFKSHHPFFKWYGSIFRRSLSAFKFMMVQDEPSLQRLQGIGIKNAAVTGDTRFDRVLQIKDANERITEIEMFAAKRALFMAGSTWPEDERMIMDAIPSMPADIAVVLAPHELAKSHMDELISHLGSRDISFTLFSSGNFDNNCKVLILDVMGKLSRAYRYARIAYVGGGMGDGLHNTLEPAVFGIPVLFAGNEFHKYNEVVSMKEMGAAIRVEDSTELLDSIEMLNKDEVKRKEIASKLNAYFEANRDATGRTYRNIFEGSDLL